jgi:NADH-quinone oxidoreductase subunit M
MDTLSLVTFLPLFGGIAILLMPRGAIGAIRWFALLVSAVTFALSIKLIMDFETTAAMQFVVNRAWIPTFGISYKIGIDGISLWLLILVTFLTPITILSCFSSITERIKEFFFCMLLLETTMMGAFIAQDLFLFYVFWELMLIPMYFMIGVWGGERRIYATIKFFIYTMVGSLLMLVAIIFVVFQFKAQTGILTFELSQILGTQLTSGEQWLLFLAFALAFAIKVPMFPFHTWLPDAHVEAPTPGSVILAGVLLKMGTYGFIRFAMPMFPEAALRAVPVISVLAIIGIIYGALVAMVQKDIKKLVAYSSVSHLGFVMLGLFALNTHAVEGAIYQRFAVYFMVVTLSSIGLPPLNGFVGEFLILLGVFQANMWYGILASTGVVLGAIYMLWVLQRVFFGEVTNEKNRDLKDLTPREIMVFGPLVLAIFVLGLYSKPFISKMEPSVNQFIEFVTEQRAEQAASGLPDGVEVTLPNDPRLDPPARPGLEESGAAAQEASLETDATASGGEAGGMK